MSTFNYDTPYIIPKDYGIDIAPTLLDGGVGSSGLGFIDTQVDRAYYGALAGGTGRWAFGSLRTPQRWLIDQLQGFDPDVASKPDPDFTPDFARQRYESQDLARRVAAEKRGGKELVDDIINNSVSAAHMDQRLNEILLVTQAEMEIEQYDRESYMLGYGATKAFSAVVNYVAVDPMTTISIVATAGLAAPAAAGVAAANATTLSVGARVAALSTQYSRTFRAATYLWDGLDGASSSYSQWKAMNDDGYRVYGKTYEKDENWTDDVAFGSILGLSFSAGGDAIGMFLKKGDLKSRVGSTLENMAANSSEGTLGTAIDHVSQSAFRSSKSRLERSLDTIVGSDHPVRNLLMDDDARASAMFGSRQDMDELSDWIEKNKPDAVELDRYVADRLEAAQRTQSQMDQWDDDVSDYVLGGGDEKHFFRKKAMDLLRSHMGDEFNQFRFIVDYLEEASGDARLVAQWMARGDKDRVIRAANAISAARRTSVLEDQALGAAMGRIKAINTASAADEATQAVNRINDNVTQGRFRGAVDILNEMHTEVMERTGRTLGEIDGAVNQLNDAFTRLNDEAFESLDHFKDLQVGLKKVRDTIVEHRRKAAETRRRLDSAMDPDADNATVVLNSQRIVDEDASWHTDISGAIDELKAALAKFNDAESAVVGTLDEVRRTRREIVGRAGKDALDRTMTEAFGFPLWKVEISAAGNEAVRKAAVKQTQAANRWKVEFVDRFLGENSADNALMSGSNPLRPIARERPVMARATVAQQEAILAEELSRIDPDVAKIQAGAKDLSLDDKIKAARDGVSQLQKSVEMAKLMKATGVIKSDKVLKQLDAIIKKKERAAKRLSNLADRYDAQLTGQVADLNKDITPASTVTPDMVRNERQLASKAASDKATQAYEKKVAEKGADFRYTKGGRQLRNRMREAASEANGGTAYSARQAEHQMINDELAVEKAARDKLKAGGTTDADPRVQRYNDEISSLEKRANKVKATIDGIEGRPAMIRRSHKLSSSAPDVKDVAEVSRMRARIAVAAEAGDTEFAEELNRRLYNMYGDATELPRWTALEDFFIRRERAVLAGEPTEDLLALSMEGRNVKFSVLGAKKADPVIAAGLDEVAAGLPTSPTMSSGKGRRVPTEGSAEEAADLRASQQLEFAFDTDPAVIAARDPSAGRTARYENAAVTDPKARGTTTSAPAPAGKKDAPKTKEEKAADVRTQILDKLASKDKPGERLLIMNNIMMSMGRIPALRGLGRALFRLQTAGTKFGQIHNISRQFDIIVTAFNMLDRPEALVKSLGFNNGSLRSLQNFRDQGKLSVARLASIEQKVKRAGQWTADSDLKVQAALDTGITTDLNPGELEVHAFLRDAYDRAGNRLEVTHPGTKRPNYRPREGNSRAILANQRAAQDSFRDVYADRLRTSGEPLPDELADAMGLPRGTAYNALSVADQAAFDARIVQHANEMAAETVSRLSNSLTQDGIGFRRAAQGSRSSKARVLEDAVANDPRVRKWYITSPMLEHKLYMEIRAPQIMFDAQLSEAMGTACTFDEVLAALKQSAVSVTDVTVRKEMESAIDALERKWQFATGRAQYNNKEALDAALRISTGIVRGSAGAFWGLAGLATELPRAVSASRLYGGGMSGIFDALHAIRHAGDLSIYEDIAHGVDQYASHAHSSFGSSVGTSVSERFIAPWERFWHVATGREAATEGADAFGRVTGSAVAFAEAFGETGMRAGGMQYFSGIARVVADRQAKKFITRNLDGMERLARSLESVGAVSESTDAARARFKQLAQDAGIPWDVALQMNHAGLLTPDVVKNLKNGLAGQDKVFSLWTLRGRVDDKTMGAMLEFLTSAHNFHVPTSSLASSVEAGSAIEKMFYNLTSYSRAFATNVAFRTAANGRLSTIATTYAALMVGENIYQSVREIATGKTDSDTLEQRWNEDPAGYFLSRAVKTPWLGAHHTPALSLVDAVTGGGGQNMRGNNIFSPILQSGSQFSRMLYSDEKTGKRDFSFMQSHTPLLNTWYSRLMLGDLEN
jgi:hypothetical protein